MISIIIPAHNEEKYLASTIKSIREGLTLPHEIIVADGSSTDNTFSIARELADKAVQYTRSDIQNISKNRNNGALHAEGDFLVFVDCGVRMVNPDAFFKKALTHFNDPRVVALAVSYRSIPEVERVSDLIVHQIINFTYSISNNILHKGIAVGKFQMMRRGAFNAVGGYREDLVTGEDNDMFARLSKIGRTAFDRSLVIYHENRRARAIGWIRLLTIWTINTLYVVLLNKSYSKHWKQVEK